MATTTLVDSTFSVSTITARTNSAGTAVADISAEEFRLAAQILEPGYIEPTTAFTVRQQSSPAMSVRVGGDTAKADVYVVEGVVAGQGNYIVRHDATPVTVTIDASDASQTRTDEIYLVVRDNTYDSSSRGLPQIGYRKGDLGGANPGPDAAWKAYDLLARVTVAATVTTIVTANISDQRQSTSLKTGLYQDQTDGFYYTKDEIDDLLEDVTTGSHGHDPLAAAMVGTAPTRGHARYSSNDDQDIADHVQTAVSFGTADDTDTLVTRSTQGSGHKFAVGAAGIWAITSCARYQEAEDVTGDRRLEIVSDNYGGTQTIAKAGNYSTGGEVSVQVHYEGWFDSGDFFYIAAYHNCDEELTLDGDIAHKNVQITLIRRTA